MSFSECLQGYLQKIGCTAAELADASQISKSNISRYLSGKRVPDPHGDVPKMLARALQDLALERGIDTADAHDLQAALELAAGFPDAYDSFPERLNDVLTTFDVANNRLARFMGFDPSYISRILSGQRTPADMPRFIDGVADYVARNCSSASITTERAKLIFDDSLDSPTDSRAIAEMVRRYLCNGVEVPRAQEDTMGKFLEKLDEFDLNVFLKGIHFDEIKVPTAPFQFPTTKTYEGIDEMKQAELDFIKAAVLSKSTEDIILYSDMPLSEMAVDDEFPKKIMTGMAMLIRKGIHLRNIHDVHRPINELFMGMEGWIPVYLTGQITPYYLPQPTNSTFLHFIRSAATVAVSGEAIAGNQAGGRYVVTKSPSDVAYFRRRATELLAHAKPLMRIYREDDIPKLDQALRRLKKGARVDPVAVGTGTFQNMTINVWPQSHALIEKSNSPKVMILVEYPALVDALERYEPTLFEESA